MDLEDITPFLTEIFGELDHVQEGESWQVDTPELRLLVLLSEDQNWLRILVPIAPLEQVAGVLSEILAANFDQTQEARYGLHEGVLWGVFQHNLETLSPADFSSALGRLVNLKHRGIADCFRALIYQQLRQIIAVAKQQGQSMEATLQSVDRLYQEGVLGRLDQGTEATQEILAIWRARLAELWPEVQPESEQENT